MLLICQKHLYDYTDNYTPNGYRTRGTKRTPLCSHCLDRVAVRQLHRTSIAFFEDHWGQDTLIGTPVCRVCYDECLEKSRIEEESNMSAPPPHSQPATESITDADGITTVFSQVMVGNQSDLHKSQTL